MVFDTSSALWEVVYIITPKESFKQLVANHKDARRYLESVIWPVGSRDKWDWREEDYELLAKLTFILAHYIWGTQYPNLEFNVVDETLLNPDVLAAQTFDQWWKLEKANVPFGYQMLFEKITVAEAKLIPKTGNAHIDSWIDNLVEVAIYRTKKELIKSDIPSFLRSKKPSQDEEK
jgi:hypothetical protein